VSAHGSGRAWAPQPGPVPPPQPGAGQLAGARAAPDLGTGHLSGDGDGVRMGQDMASHGWAGQAYGELETSPAVASLGQELMAPAGLQ